MLITNTALRARRAMQLRVSRTLVRVVQIRLIVFTRPIPLVTPVWCGGDSEIGEPIPVSHATTYAHGLLRQRCAIRMP